MEIKKRISVLLCCLVFLCLSTSTFASLSMSTTRDVISEVAVLLDIKDNLVDPRGVLDNWFDYNPDPCNWDKVTCSSDNLVIRLELPSLGLSGTLSPSIGELKNVEVVVLPNNNISGLIPSEIGSLPKLQTLDLSNNTFSGHIPSTISHLKTLQYLRLSNNNLSGEIPASLANLTQLCLIDLSYNNLSGPMPSSPAKIFNIEGNPYICNNGAGEAGSTTMEKGSLSSSGNTKQNYATLIPSVILLILVFYQLELPFRIQSY